MELHSVCTPYAVSDCLTKRRDNSGLLLSDTLQHEIRLNHGHPTRGSQAACGPLACIMRRVATFINYVLTIKLHNNSSVRCTTKKVKFALEQAMKAQKWSRGIALLFL